MIKTAVIGHPVAHSKSPKIHSYWLQKYGLEGSYTAIDIAPENLATGVRQLIAEGYAGFNVTVPHKIAIMALCTTLSPAAQAIGAVNTVSVQKDGTLYGHNTDGFGFAANLDEALPLFGWSAGPAVVIGAGGAAHAILWALQERGVPHIYVTNRTAQKAQEVATSFGAKKVAWEDRHDCLAGAHLLINASSLGMVGQSSLDLDLRALPQQATVYDIVYNPQMTPLLLEAQKKGCRVVTGLGMLLHQARPAFEGWYGIMPEVTNDLRQLLDMR